MRPYYQALIALRANPKMETASDYLIELLTWFSMRLPTDNPRSLAKDIDRAWVSYARRACEVVSKDRERVILTEGMFRQSLAQLPRVQEVKDGEFLFRCLFKEIGWDYDYYVNPVVGDDEIVCEIEI